MSTPSPQSPHLLPTTGDAAISASDDKATTPDRHWDCFLSHNWGINDSNHLKVKRINDALKSNSLQTWFNEDKYIDDVQKQAAEGVENSSVIVVFITAAYHQKVNNGDSCDNCYYEFNYSLSKKGAKCMIAVVMEAAMCNQCEWEGAFSTALGSSLYIDFSGAFNDDIIFNQKMNELIARVSSILP